MQILIDNIDRTKVCCGFLRSTPSIEKDIKFTFRYYNKNIYKESLNFLKYIVFKTKQISFEDKFLIKYEFDDLNGIFNITFNNNKNTYMLIYGIFCYLRRVLIDHDSLNKFNDLVKAYPNYNKLHLFEIALRYKAINGGVFGYLTQSNGLIQKIYSFEEVVEKLYKPNLNSCQIKFNSINTKINQQLYQEIYKEKNLIKFAKIILNNRT
jgi:hypothetical protein